MPHVDSTYTPPRFFGGPDLMTIYSGALRPRAALPYHRELIPFGADELLELDWLIGGGRSLVIITHGLTGSSRGRHVSRMAAALHRRDFDILAWNFLGAGEEINRGLGWYHSGSSDQLRAVVNHALTSARYRSIALVGFSLGGNVTLKYLGEEGAHVAPGLTSAVVLSVPCDLASCAAALAAPRNRIYMANFLYLLGKKLRAKAEQHPGAIDLTGYRRIKTFAEYDARYTAPLHGFQSAGEYWRLSSSRPLIGAIKLPTTIISALDDPFLTPACFPFDETRTHPYVTLEASSHGGHVGFVDSWRAAELWSERRAAELLTLDMHERRNGGKPSERGAVTGGDLTKERSERVLGS